LGPGAFADFETIILANGLKVWYKRLSEDPVVSVSVALPFGSDRDPEGKEQLAHFTEHMQFADQPGLSEEEIKREIEERGGVYNASVARDRTFYFVRIGKEHALFAIDWLYRVLAPHAMDPEVVERQREPVALEVRARPRQLFDWIWAYYLNPPGLRLPGFWEREFGIETVASRDYYPFASLNAITSDDLRWFYRTYYVPSRMTLTIVGDIDRAAALEKIEATFASLSARTEPEPPTALHDPGRRRASFFWAYRSNVLYSNRYKFYDLAADEQVMLIFVSRLLSKRLNDQLRFGERKATYGIRVGIVKRGGAAYLGVSGGIRDDEFEYARSVVEREIEALSTGTLPPEEFEADRAAVTKQLRVSNSAAEDLEYWVQAYFYDPRVFRDFPDLAGKFEAYSKDEVEAFVRERFGRERQVLMVVYPHPITQGILATLVIALVWFGVRIARRILTSPVDMTRIRYVARFRMPRPYLWLGALVLLVLFAIGGRLLAYGYAVVADGLLLQRESFLVQWLAYAAMLLLSVLLFVLALSRVPRKLLVFDDRLLIKSLSYRSTALSFADVDELSVRRFSDVWMNKRIWKCVPLTIGLFRPGIYLRRRNGWAYYFDVRDRGELLRVTEEKLARNTERSPSDG
jgi:predicted Zn-dependent peptidase